MDTVYKNPYGTEGEEAEADVEVEQPKVKSIRQTKAKTKAKPAKKRFWQKEPEEEVVQVSINKVELTSLVLHNLYKYFNMAVLRSTNPEVATFLASHTVEEFFENIPLVLFVYVSNGYVTMEHIVNTWSSNDNTMLDNFAGLLKHYQLSDTLATHNEEE